MRLISGKRLAEPFTPLADTDAVLEAIEEFYGRESLKLTSVDGTLVFATLAVDRMSLLAGLRRRRSTRRPMLPRWDSSFDENILMPFTDGTQILFWEPAFAQREAARLR